MNNVKVFPIVLLCIIAGAVPAKAQKYIVDVILRDSVAASEIVRSGNEETAGVEVFRIANGDEVTITRLLKREGNNYGVILKDGKEYCIWGNDLVFSDDNPEGTVDVFGGMREGKHTFIEHFFCSSMPYIFISLLFLTSIVFVFLGLRLDSLRHISLIVVPVCIMGAALMEIWAYATLGDDVFWWCDYNRYGFWESFFRAIPYVGFVYFQILSIRFYQNLLFGKDSDKKIAIKPMFWGMGACIPMTVAAAVVCTVAGWRSATDIVSSVTFLVTLGLGMFYSYRRNVRDAGAFRGLMLTLFCAVYVIGSIIAVWGLVIVLFKIIVQILLAIAIFFGLMFAASAGTRYRDSSGRVYEDDGFGNLRRVN